MALSSSKNPKSLLFLEFIFYRIWAGRDLKDGQFHCHICGNAFEMDSWKCLDWKRALRSSAVNSALECGVKELLEWRGRAQGEGEERKGVLGEVFGESWWFRRGCGIIPGESRNPERAWFGEDFQDYPVPPHAMSRDTFRHPRVRQPGLEHLQGLDIPSCRCGTGGCSSPPDCGRAASRDGGGNEGVWDPGEL